jgi:hypothetical protein
MSSNRTLAIILIVGGVLGLAYGGFSYTQDTHKAQIGPIDVSVSERKTINIPIWAGVSAIVIGGVLLLGVNKRS